MYTSEYITLSLIFMDNVFIAMSGVNIIVKNPFDISDIILAIFFLSIVNCNSKKIVWQRFKEKDY